MIKKYGFLTILILAYLIGYAIGFFGGMDDFHTTGSGQGESQSVSLFDLPIHERFFEIFKNNMIVSFKNMLLGALSFGLFSIIYTFYNGFCFGLVSGASSHVLSLSEILGSTLPHSFEFIGIVLYGNIGFLISVYAFTHKQILTKKTLLWMFIIATMIILFAAIIENYVSMSN
jgi:uncharacterized membrane protein SpoIIM required for sporulation